MVTFGTITEKNLRVNYVKEDIEGYKVVGNASYNKENVLTDAYGNIRDTEDKHIANFNVYGTDENARVSINDCIPVKMSEAVEVATATLKDLTADYPKE